jgi:hypothetical protein
MSASRPHPPASPATMRRSSAERAATRGRIATEGEDERAGSKSALSVRRRPREPDRTAGTLTRWRPLDRLKRVGTLALAGSRRGALANVAQPNARRERRAHPPASFAESCCKRSVLSRDILY